MSQAVELCSRGACEDLQTRYFNSLCRTWIEYPCDLLKVMASYLGIISFPMNTHELIVLIGCLVTREETATLIEERYGLKKAFALYQIAWQQDTSPLACFKVVTSYHSNHDYSFGLYQ